MKDKTKIALVAAGVVGGILFVKALPVILVGTGLYFLLRSKK